MGETINLTKTVLVKLLDFFPNPDDPEPHGPGGPVIRAIRAGFRFEPHPDPWRSGPSPDPWRLGPQPDPWRSAVIARTIIDRAVAQYQLAEVEQSKSAVEGVRLQMRAYVDDFCGTRPPRWPRPWPWPPKFDPADVHPVELLIAGAEFQRAAALNNPLQADFSAAADQLFENGFKRLAERK